MYDNLLADVPTDLWIGGKWRKASDQGRFDVIDPATERKIASVASATVDDAKAAVDDAGGDLDGCGGEEQRAPERKIASVASPTVDDAKAAVDAAGAAFDGWAGKKPRERAEILRKSYELIMRDAERLAQPITLENCRALSVQR